MLTFLTRRLGAVLCMFGVIALTACDEEPRSSDVMVPERAPLRALTPLEYNHTVADLLGFPWNGKNWPEPHPIAESLAPMMGDTAIIFGGQIYRPWPWTFPAEVGVEHFESMEDGQVPSPYLVEELQKAANHFASYALVSPLFFTCESFASLGRDEALICAWDSVLRFAQRAWRRPMDTESRQELQSFWSANLEGESIEEAIGLTLAGILQSPAFLYHLEVGIPSSDEGARRLTAFEQASRLSYFLWDTMPDAALFRAADNGELSRVSGIAAQTRRMLADTKARKSAIHFHHQLLGLDDVKRIAPARRAYGMLFGVVPDTELDTTGDQLWPQVTGAFRHSIEAEVDLFIEKTIFESTGTFHNLMTSHFGYQSSASAPVYGEPLRRLSVPNVTTEYEYIAASLPLTGSLELYGVEFDPSKRAGLLTQPAVLALGAYAVNPAPILRGKMLLERLACETMGTPPPGAEGAIPPDISEAEGTNRFRTEAATAAPVCASCHEQINPPGFAFEHYDAVGQWRALDNGEPVDASGSFPLRSGELIEFGDAIELGEKLARSNQILDCYVKRWVDYANGYTLSDDHVELQQLQTNFRESDEILELLVAITTSDFFRYLPMEGDL